MRKIYFCVFLITISFSCSQYKNGPLSKTWHNTNAKYNALLISREDYKIAKEIILANNKETYEEILPIYRKIDSTKLDSAALYLTDAIKKASIIAERHSNSRHLDEAYLLIGKARLEKEEIFNAQETFKYVNTTSKSSSSKTEALIWLMRSYIENEDLVSANQVAELLKTQKLSGGNKSQFLATKAYYHQIQNEPALAVVFLDEALKSMKKGTEKARLHFITAQLYSSLNQVVLSRKNYNQVLKNKPNYDLEFHAKLGLISSQSLAKNTNITFEKMLEDRKNQDLRSKIFYRIGETEARKGNYEAAILNFNKAVTESNDNPKEKALAYKALGDLYFEELVNYEMAGIYYDSTLITLPKNEQNSSQIGQKAMFLNDFIKYKKAYDLEDSLQMLASLNPNELDFKLEQMILDKKEAQKKEQEAVANSSSVLKNASNSTLPRDFKRWLLYDPVESVKAKNEFVRNWGNRPLEDNWRRSEKTMGSFSLKIERQNLDSVKTELKNTANSEEEMKELLAKKEVEQEKKEMLKKIPSSNIQKMASKRKQEEALFQIGKIYKLKFNDEDKAKTTFGNLIKNFPRSVYEPEALYYLSIMEKDPQNNTFSSKLLKEYPSSSFARQLKKGSIKLSKDKETEVQTAYSKVFDLYEKNNFTEALTQIDQNLNEYVGSQIEDKMAMLRIMILKKLSNKEQYVISLNDFIRSYPSSDLILKAKELLAVLN
ncbi:MAG TPA: tetratricopeptide repeat protein [Leadbetterella sp.]|nr:tetratricopeptide repeat protein [Leadbetterella sp.]